MQLSDLKAKIEAGQAKLAVIGLGYVGLPVACEFARVGFDVLGVEIDVPRAREDLTSFDARVARFGVRLFAKPDCLTGVAPDNAVDERRIRVLSWRTNAAAEVARDRTICQVRQ